LTFLIQIAAIVVLSYRETTSAALAVLGGSLLLVFAWGAVGIWLTDVSATSSNQVTYYRTDPETGWTLQRIDNDAVLIQHGDAVFARSGLRPAVTSPETRLYAQTYGTKATVESCQSSADNGCAGRRVNAGAARTSTPVL